MFIAIALFAILASLLIQFFVFGPRQYRSRAKFLTEYTVKRGYRLANPSIAQISATSSAKDILTNPSLKDFANGPDGITDIEGLERAPDDPFAFTCQTRSKDVMIFEVSVHLQGPMTRAALSITRSRN